ncbi:ABC transporter ATP-binding protein [Actinomyces sp. 594]|uniref:ABC transporter ATP-binding protein n=1 Tax=Actinomyces sp. 594 TaxID=2057793 RepID=UPI001C59E457|nr:ABC transporter ATP-binding protein [Actinomyces sp. 594]MBW3068407.1 ABC transporter ATP-binding protein [Actinomyces sp. 594]
MNRRLPVADAVAVRRRALELIREHKGAVAAVTTLQLLAALAAVGIPRVLGDMVDLVAGAEGAAAASVAGRLQGLIAVVIALAIGNAVLTGCGEYLARVLGERVFAELRERLVGSAMHLPLSVVESAGTGDLLGRTGRDLESIRNVVQRGVSQILVIVLTLLTIVVAAVITSPRLSPAMIVPLLAVVPVWHWYLRHAVPAYRAMNAMWAEVDGVIAETADQADTVDAHALGARRNRILDRATIEVWSTEQYTLWLRIVLLTALGLGSFVPVIAVVAWGAWLAGRGAVTLGAITTVALYAIQLRTPVSEVTYWIDSLQSAGAAMSRIVGVELVRPDRDATSGAVTGRPPRARGVSYAYRPGHDVLHDVDLELIPGERLAVVGPSGSGKSTLGRMLAGVHPPTRGRVTVGDGEDGDGIDLTALTEDALHREVVLVTQEHHVFACSLADNLRLARTDATDAELKRALEVVGADDWVGGLSDGLETLVGAGGAQLTPGQAQQVALARIVLMDPATLVLDEATSLLDPSVARSAERSLDAVLAGRTVVAIAHRLDTAAAADRVAVVIDGRIVELGPHAELLAAEGEYTRLWRAWASR